MQRTEKQDIYTRITNQIVSHLEKGVRPWVRPWNAEHAAGRITRPLRHNGKPYSGINVLSLWASAMAQNFAAPMFMNTVACLNSEARSTQPLEQSFVAARFSGAKKGLRHRPYAMRQSPGY
jgi:antirestriction protein ArdC